MMRCKSLQHIKDELRERRGQVQLWEVKRWREARVEYVGMKKDAEEVTRKGAYVVQAKDRETAKLMKRYREKKEQSNRRDRKYLS